MLVIEQAWGQEGWILAKLFWVFMDQDGAINLRKKDEANIQPSWPSKLGQIWIYYMGKECHFLMAHRLGYTLFWEIGQKHPKFLFQFTQNQSEHNFFTIQGWLVQSVINPLTWSFLQKMCFLDILVVFRLDLGQLSFNLVKNALCNTPECLSCH